MRLHVAPDTAREQPVFAPADPEILCFWPTLKAERLAVGALIASAVAVRLAYYLVNPSLSVDEADLALNLMHRSYFGLLDRLDFNQAAPAGFLLLQKLTVDSLGATPYVLRLMPLVAGIASSLLIYPIAARIVGRRAAIIALALFAVSDPLMSYAATNKQYSLDVAVALGLYAVALSSPDQIGMRHGGVTLAFSGIVAVWLSHPAAFVLAGIGTTFAIERARDRRWREMTSLLAVGTAWLASFSVAYLLTRSSVEQVQHSIAATGRSTPFGSNGRPGLLQTYGGIVRNVLGIPMFGHGLRSAIAAVAISIALVGLIVVLLSRLPYAALIVLPAAFALIATAAHLYSNQPRTYLFLIPALLILVAEGVRFLMMSKWPRIIAVGGATVLALLTGTATYATIDHLRTGPQTEPVQAIRYLTQRARVGDSLYVYHTAQYVFRYYLECGCFGERSEIQNARRLWPIRPTGGYRQFAPALKSAAPRLIVGESTGEAASDYRKEFKPLRGRRRVWVLVIDARPEARRALEAFLSRGGTRTETFPSRSERAIASVSLHDLRGGP